MKCFSVLLLVSATFSLYGTYGKYRKTEYDPQVVGELMARVEVLRTSFIASQEDRDGHASKRRKVALIPEPQQQQNSTQERR